jgi:hypothetical protein
VVADRDLLAVRNTRANLRVLRGDLELRGFSAPGLGCAAMEVDEPVDWMVVRSEPSAGSLWEDELMASAEHLLQPGGRLLIISRSTSISRLGRKLGKKWGLLDSVKSRGFRADLLRAKH